MNSNTLHRKNPVGSVALAASLALALAACSSTPHQNDRLDAARVAVQRAATQSDMTGAARADVETAQRNLQRAETAQKKGDRDDVDHYAYIAEQSAQAAINRHESVQLRKKVDDAEGERSKVLLEAREREAKLAEHKAETARAEVARVQDLAEQQSTELAARSRQLDVATAMIAELKAQKTDRGMVVTLGDVLFDTGSSVLKPGADRTLQQVASYLSSNPQARLLVEGHTDNVGEESFNQRLSQQRAESVTARLVSLGVEASRMTATGLGEGYPVTGNDIPAGRQQNRRVEVVFSDNSGAFPQNAQRSAGSASMGNR